MATKQPSKTSTVKAKSVEKSPTAPKVSRARTKDSIDAMPARSPAREEIAARAYERFVERGYQHGHDVDDWLHAERELTQRS